MRKKITLFTLTILFISAGLAHARVTLEYSSRGVEYFTLTIQDEWQVNVGSEFPQSPDEDSDKTGRARLISAMPNDGMPLWFGLWVPEALKNIEGAEEYIASLGLDLLSNFVTAERRFDTINAMNVLYVSGTGKKDDEIMDLHAVFYQISPEHVAIAVYIGPPETTEQHGADLAEMIHSLHAVTRQ